MMDKVKKFLAQYNITTHTVAGAVVFLIAAYHNSQAVHDFAWHIWVMIPTTAKEAATAVASIVMLYWQGRKEWTPEERAKELGGTNEIQKNSANSAAAGTGGSV